MTPQNGMIATLEQYVAELDAILSRFSKTRDGIYIAQKDDSRFRQIVLELRDLFEDNFVEAGRHSQPLIQYFSKSISNFTGSPSFQGVENVNGVVVAALARVRRNALSLKTAALEAKATGAKNPEVLISLAERLHDIVRQLRKRHDNRPTLDVGDEYDLQDLLHALLTIHFDDIRSEEWTPSYAGGAARIDFLLPEIEAAVEVKMTRPSLSRKRLGEELIIDREKYTKHPQCRSLYCIVYDPDGWITNPRGLESDLNKDDHAMITRVLIVPR